MTSVSEIRENARVIRLETADAEKDKTPDMVFSKRDDDENSTE